MRCAILITTNSFRNTDDPDIFDGIALFHQNKHCFVAYDKLFLKNLLGLTFANSDSPGWGL
jgi:hypothetical protein